MTIRTPYAQARKEFAEHPLRQSYVPLEHYVSTPLPTLRWGGPGYAAFAAPAVRAPRQPLRIDAPDRWWAIGAERPRLLAYALVPAVPFTDAPLGGPVTVTPGGRTLAESREDHRAFDELMDLAAPAFFATGPAAAAEPGGTDASAEGAGPAGAAEPAGQRHDPTVRADLAALLPLVLPREVHPWARALAPDFFAWLEGR
ncbi:hypothetical protein ACFCX4_33275 [Kitasatospora sp. NPDC056327]|uniref:hypothetical protein n=1 Tax=Kitasatospora sp. NPDC056327 TaxID=3345785 RepID=UPI0035E2C777